MKLLKKKNIFTSLVLALIICFSFLLPSFFNSEKEIKTRDINVNELGILSYEEKVDQLLKSFDEYKVSNNDSLISFEASTNISNYDFFGVQYLSTSADETIKKYRTNLDIENEVFEIITEYIQDGEIVHVETVETIPQYDEYSDDYYLIMPDNTTVSLSDTLTPDCFNQCSVTLMALGLALTAEEAAVLITTVAIVAAPVIVEVVNVVVTKVVSWVKSFWRWFKSLWTKKTTTVVTTTVTTTLSYTLTLSYTDGKTKVEAKPFDKTKKYEDKKYYFAIADTTDGLLYVSEVPIGTISALAILKTSSFVCSAHKNDNKKFVVSLYTPSAVDAYLIACEAGRLNGSPGAIHHIATKIGYFNHYHPGLVYTDMSHPHVFYGLPMA